MSVPQETIDISAEHLSDRYPFLNASATDVARTVLAAAAPDLRAEGAAAVRDRIRQLPLALAMSDPGAVLPRLPDERLPAWQLRAVLHVIGAESQ